MDPKIEQFLINKLAEVSTAEQSVTINREGKSVAVILSAADYQKFQAEQETRLQNLKIKLNGILSFIRSSTRRRSLEEVEAQLSLLRQKIEKDSS